MNQDSWNDTLLLDLDSIGMDRVADVGGKNASLGEMRTALTRLGVRVPPGFATTARAYWHFMDENGLSPVVDELLGRVAESVGDAGKRLRRAIRAATIPDDLREAVLTAYGAMNSGSTEPVHVAVRSSATAEDLPDASFAGQQESYLNVHGAEALLTAWKNCVASLFTDRAITYREQMGFDHLSVALSVGVQEMVRSDLGTAGVMFTLDPDTGFPGVIVINASWGLGEYVVKGRVNPDTYVVFKPLLDNAELRPIIERTLGTKERTLQLAADGASGTRDTDTPASRRRQFALSDDDVLHLARWGVAIESHYGRPMDIEWAKDGGSGELFIVQARPETVESRAHAGTLETFVLEDPPEALCEGVAIGHAVVSGTARQLGSVAEADRLQPGEILVAPETDPDWGPVLPRAAGIVTDRGGRTSHAAIVSRELGIPAVVGVEDATRRIRNGSMITVSCAEGEIGRVYDGMVPYTRSSTDVADLPKPSTPVMLNLGNPDAAFRWWRLPTQGVGLVRIEFMISEKIGVHPMALATFDTLPPDLKGAVRRSIGPDGDARAYFVDALASGIGKIAAFAYPFPAIVRTSDFKTNEYAGLIGGESFELVENNPMIGFRGAVRYGSERYRKAFEMECEALVRVRAEMGFKNVIPMIPFCRTLAEADAVLDLMASAGLARGVDGLEIYMMCEIPANVVLAHEFAGRFDGFSIGSNDLTQLTLGVDRDSPELSGVFDERDPAVTRMIESVIRDAHDAGIPVGICGQAPSDHPDFARFLVQSGIDSLSVSPDSVVDVIRTVAGVEESQRPRDTDTDAPRPRDLLAPGRAAAELPTLPH